ncbi:MAG: thioredoxin domain-containing protein [Proteobacteria bacterium]|nr:thioredoxin domain-containing protein [Pseudomonadota bacterium]
MPTFSERITGHLHPASTRSSGRQFDRPGSMPGPPWRAARSPRVDTTPVPAMIGYGGVCRDSGATEQSSEMIAHTAAQSARWLACLVLLTSVDCKPDRRSSTGSDESSSAQTTVQPVQQTPGQGGPGDFVLPGAQPFDAALAARLRQAVARRGAGYKPRTRHKHADGSALYINRLIFESSPYLLQHAHNPVNWYPWGERAFETAKRLDRPVLLSVGYSTCHWCHVMEEESFEDPDIAAYINANYVAIKVDREELPDVDSIYMGAVRYFTRGRGGWPMTVWLTPDRKPFFGGTYFPPRAGVRGSGVGFFELLEGLKTAYDGEREQIAERAHHAVAVIQRMNTPPASLAFDASDAEAALHQAIAYYKSGFDPVNGGMKGQPKFPSSLPVRVLLRYYRRTNDAAVLRMAETTLTRMAAGGIYDHVAGGFHRYSTDRRWLVPHFEKMLYDNARLTLAYLEAHQITGRDDFAEVAREILHYVARDMTAPEGPFYSATDADSKNPAGHTEEGWFFTWTPNELAAVLDPDGYALARALFAVEWDGNFEGRTILSRPAPLDEVASGLGMSPAEARQTLAAIKQILYRERAKRPRPLRDEKFLTSWNGLMISAFARAAVVLSPAANQPDYAEHAGRAADFILSRMRRKNGLYRVYKDGKAKIPGYLDDYAFFIAALLDLFEATSEPRYIAEAIALDRVVQERFQDRVAGGYYYTSSADHEPLLAREKPTYDGAIPSGSSISLVNLLRLYELTTETEYRKRADELIASLSAVVKRDPTAMSELLLGLDFVTDTAKEIVIVVPRERRQAQPFLDVISTSFLPNTVLAVVDEETTRGKLGRRIPLLKSKVAQRGQATAYVCERQRCELPTRDPAVFRRQIAEVVPMGPVTGQSSGPSSRPPAKTPTAGP